MRYCTSKNVERSWRTDVVHIDTCVIISAGLVQCTACSQSHKMRLHARVVWQLSHRRSVKKQCIVSHKKCTKYQNSTSVRFCHTCRPGPTTTFLNVCRHVKHYCPFTQSSFCNILQTLRNFARNVGVKRAQVPNWNIIEILIFKSIFYLVIDFSVLVCYIYPFIEKFVFF